MDKKDKGWKIRKPCYDHFMTWYLGTEGKKIFPTTPQEVSDRTKNQTQAPKLQSCALTTQPKMPVKY